MIASTILSICPSVRHIHGPCKGNCSFYHLFYTACCVHCSSFITPNSMTQSIMLLQNVCALLLLSVLILFVRQQEGYPACKKSEYWFFGGDDLTGFLIILRVPVITCCLHCQLHQSISLEWVPGL